MNLTTSFSNTTNVFGAEAAEFQVDEEKGKDTGAHGGLGKRLSEGMEGREGGGNWKSGGRREGSDAKVGVKYVDEDSASSDEDGDEEDGANR